MIRDNGLALAGSLDKSKNLFSAESRSSDWHLLGFRQKISLVLIEVARSTSVFSGNCISVASSGNKALLMVDSPVVLVFNTPPECDKEGPKNATSWPNNLWIGQHKGERYRVKGENRLRRERQ